MSDIIDIDPDTGEILPTETSTALERVDYTPTIVLTPQAAGGLVAQVREIQRAVMQEGTDYGTIPGTPKPSLYKPGAERLLQVFGLGHRMERVDVIPDEKGMPFGVTFRCVVTRNLADGREVTVSSCEGYAGRDEGKWRGAPWNTILKMAQKRALVGAALTATGASGMFTQDIEDYDRDDRGEGRMQPRQQARQSAPRGDGGDRPQIKEPGSAPSEKQLKMMNAVMGTLGLAGDDRGAFVKAVLGEAKSSKEITKGEASQIIDKLKAVENGDLTMTYGDDGSIRFTGGGEDDTRREPEPEFAPGEEPF